MASNTPYEPVANPALGDRPHSPGVALDHYPDVDVQPRFLGPEARSAGGPYTRESYISTHSGYASQHTTGSTPYFEPYSDLPGGESTADLYQGGGTGSQSYGQSYGASTAEKYPPTSFPSTAARKSKSKWIGITLAAIVVIAAGAGLGVYFAVIRPKHTGAAGSSPDSNHTSGNAPHSGSNSLGTMLGKDGSLVVTSDGSSFTYKNSFGGYWVLDQSTPFNDGARPQSWSPALNDTFDYGGVDKIRG